MPCSGRISLDQADFILSKGIAYDLFDDFRSRGCKFGRFDDDAVAGCPCRDQRSDAKVDGIIPGRQNQHYTLRFRANKMVRSGQLQGSGYPARLHPSSKPSPGSSQFNETGKQFRGDRFKGWLLEVLPKRRFEGMSMGQQAAFQLPEPLEAVPKSGVGLAPTRALEAIKKRLVGIMPRSARGSSCTIRHAPKIRWRWARFVIDLPSAWPPAAFSHR